MFQKTAASFDECSTAGVFLSTLHCPDYRSELLFPTDIQTLSSGEPPELPDLGWVEVTDLKGESSAASHQSSSVIREVSVYNHGQQAHCALVLLIYSEGSSGKTEWAFFFFF